MFGHGGGGDERKIAEATCEQRCGIAGLQEGTVSHTKKNGLEVRGHSDVMESSPSPCAIKLKGLLLFFSRAVETRL